MSTLKCFRFKEIMGTAVQLMVVAILLPFIAILFGIILGGQDVAQQNFFSAIISMLPYSDEIQGLITGAGLASSSVTVMDYLMVVLKAVTENIMVGMYVGMWLHAFRIIFKEIVKIPGLPVIQTVVGLLFGALTLNMVQDPMMVPLVILFLVALNIVLTIIFVKKTVWQKILDLAVNLSFQCLLAALTSGYALVISMVFNGYFTDVKLAISLIVMVTLAMIIYLIIQYILLIRK